MLLREGIEKTEIVVAKHFTLNKEHLPSNMVANLVVAQFATKSIGTLFPLIEEYINLEGSTLLTVEEGEHETRFLLNGTDYRWVATINNHYIDDALNVLYVYNQIFTGQLRD